jgi:phospholipase C
MSNLAKFDHLVVLALENRSLDNLCGYLYEGSDQPARFIGDFHGERSFDGVAGKDLWNPSPDEPPRRIPVGRAPNDKPFDMSEPYPDPGETFAEHVTMQLYGTDAPSDEELAAPPPMSGFVRDYARAIGEQILGKREISEAEYRVIMNCFTPDAVPVLSGLARAFAISDRWFCSVPSQTFCNRSFMHSAQSNGFVTNANYIKWRANTAPTIEERLAEKGISSRVYFDEEDLFSITRAIHPRLHASAFDGMFRHFEGFARDCAAGDLPAYTFIEPRLFMDHNDQHPPFILNSLVASSVLAGELLIHDVYAAIRANEALWERTLLVITYDEHGGCYDHVPPPTGVSPPVVPLEGENEHGFRFDRLGVRVPAVFVSPYIDERTLIRASGPVPFDHTSIIRTLCEKYALAQLTGRDARAPSLAPLLTRDAPRKDAPIITPRPYVRASLPLAQSLPISEHQRSILEMFGHALGAPASAALMTVEHALAHIKRALRV